MPVASAAANDKEIVHNTCRPKGCGGTVLVFSLHLLNDAEALLRRRALISEKSRSQQVRTYL